MSSEIYNFSSNDEVLIANNVLSQLTDEEIAYTLAHSLQIESFQIQLGFEADGYSVALYNEWLKRVGRLPYTKELNYFVYDDLPEFDIEHIIKVWGESTLSKIIIMATKKELNEKEILFMESKLKSLIKSFSSDSNLLASYEKAKEALIKKYGQVSSIITSFVAHIINKAINNTFPPEVFRI